MNHHEEIQRAFNHLEQLYLDGQYHRARLGLERLADYGHTGAQFYVARMLEQGRGLPANPTEAAWWYTLAAESGCIEAQTNLAAMYQEGRGVEQDVPSALRWYRRAASAGDVEAQLGLSVLLVDRGEMAEALAWSTVAAEQGDHRAVENVLVLRDSIAPQECVTGMAMAHAIEAAPALAA